MTAWCKIYLPSLPQKVPVTIFLNSPVTFAEIRTVGELTTPSGITVRVIDYALPSTAGTQTRYRLLTTLLDEQRAPALELATIYHERWEVEAVFDELKTHLLQKRRVLRSKTPDLIRQEFYGWVLAHYAVRWLMHQAATEHRQEPRSLSFTANVQLLRRAQPQSGAFPPSATPKTKALV